MMRKHFDGFLRTERTERTDDDDLGTAALLRVAEDPEIGGRITAKLMLCVLAALELLADDEAMLASPIISPP